MMGVTFPRLQDLFPRPAGIAHSRMITEVLRVVSRPIDDKHMGPQPPPPPPPPRGFSQDHGHITNGRTGGIPTVLEGQVVYSQSNLPYCVARLIAVRPPSFAMPGRA